ncbi:MAG: ADP-ribosylglycohydrolase family protein [Candidatus Methanospirareceae archaeon]
MLPKFTGALIGTAVGDALGAPVEGWSMEKVRSVYGDGRVWKMSRGRYTDDTEMMIGVAESLIKNKGFNGADMARTFVQNYDAKRGYGPGSKEVLKRLRMGESWEVASGKLFGGEGSYGNGAAMRIAPVGLFYYDNADKLREVAYKSSHITHSHELGKEGAALQAFAIALAVRGEREGMLFDLKEFVQNDVYKEKIRKIELLLDKDASRREIIAELGNGEAAFNSVPTAIYSFLRFDSFEDGVTYAVSLGGDTDTIGAMTGAISGAYYGEGAIPEEWLEELEEGEKGKSYIKRLAEKLYQSRVSIK